MSIVSASSESIRQAAEILLRGGLVVLPTETVYGLAAVFSNVEAVRAIYRAKGRPADNPLIVHVSNFDQARQLAKVWPSSADQLAAAFWPGPLTMVVERSAQVPMAVTAGLETVGIRMPSHPVAKAVVEAVGQPLAMPSANPFMRLSPTRAGHVESADLPDVELILDGGPSEIGIESTVVDLAEIEPRLLRLGRIGEAELEAVLGKSIRSGADSVAKKSPGMYPRHYAPKSKFVLVERLEVGQPGFGLHILDAQQIQMPADPIAYAATLYDVLYRLDQLGVPEIFAEVPPNEPGWEAIHDRLRKASSEA